MERTINSFISIEFVKGDFCITNAKLEVVEEEEGSDDTEDISPFVWDEGGCVEEEEEWRHGEDGEGVLIISSTVGCQEGSDVDFSKPNEETNAGDDGTEDLENETDDVGHIVD